MPNTTSVRTAQVGAAPFFAGKNKIINGDFSINQRAFSSASGASVSQYGFDRFILTNSGGTYNPSAQTFTPGTAPVAGYEASNFLRNAISGQSAAGDYSLFLQRIEDVRSFAGQTATISFWAKATSGTPGIGMEITQSFGTGGSPSTAVNTAINAVTLSTSWTRYSVTVNVPSISGKTIGTTANTSYLQVTFWLSAGSSFATRASSIGIQNSTIDVWGIQMEAGSVATAFQTATGTIQGELAACQRYYFRTTGQTTSYYTITNMGFARTTAIAYIPFQVPVTMRAMSSLEYANIRAVRASTDIGYTTGTFTFTSNNTLNIAELAYTHGSGVFTQGENVYLGNNNSASAYIAISGEL